VLDSVQEIFIEDVFKSKEIKKIEETFKALYQHSVCYNRYSAHNHYCSCDYDCFEQDNFWLRTEGNWS